MHYQHKRSTDSLLHESATIFRMYFCFNHTRAKPDRALMSVTGIDCMLDKHVAKKDIILSCEILIAGPILLPGSHPTVSSQSPPIRVYFRWPPQSRSAVIFEFKWNKKRLFYHHNKKPVFRRAFLTLEIDIRSVRKAHHYVPQD